MEQTTILTPLKVRLMDNLRYFDSDDSEFSISAKEVKELPAKHLRSYSIKLFLFSGRLRVVEGEVLFNYKSSFVCLNSKGLWGKEFDKYFIKDMVHDTVIAFIPEAEVPADIFKKLNPTEPTIVQKVTAVAPVATAKVVQPIVLAAPVIPTKEAPKPLDLNGDGKIDGKDLNILSNKLKTDKKVNSVDTMTKAELLDFAKKKGFLVEHSLNVNDMRNEIKAYIKAMQKL